MLWAYSITHREQLSIFLASLVLPGKTSRVCHLQTGSDKKGFVILTIIIFTRVATVDMVLREDTGIVPCDNQLWVIQ